MVPPLYKIANINYPFRSQRKEDELEYFLDWGFIALPTALHRAYRQP